jgi:hypothetical protein
MNDIIKELFLAYEDVFPPGLDALGYCATPIIPWSSFPWLLFSIININTDNCSVLFPENPTLQATEAEIIEWIKVHTIAVRSPIKEW